MAEGIMAAIVRLAAEDDAKKAAARDLPMSEAEFLGRPHPAVVDHTAAVVERVQALTPPSLVRMDRAEALVAAVVAWRNLELGGQYDTPQVRDALGYMRDLTDRYIEAES